VRALDAAAKFAEKPLDGFSTPTSAAAKRTMLRPPAPKTTSLSTWPRNRKRNGTQQPAPAGAKYTGEPISVNLKDVDLKDFFRLIHEISD